MAADEADARRLFTLTEPLCLVSFFAPEPRGRLVDLGLRGYWHGYFASRAAPLGRVSARVVRSVFYGFTPAEVERHIPRVWDLTTPEAAWQARVDGCEESLTRILGNRSTLTQAERAAELLLRATDAAPTEGRPMFAALRDMPLPNSPVAQLWHGANMVREHRGDGHISALMTAGLDGTEAHMMKGIDSSVPPREFGRIHHLDPDHLNRVHAGLVSRGLVDGDEWTEAGKALWAEVELTTDRLAAPAYDALSPAELRDLVDALEPLAATVAAAGSR